MRIIQAGQLKGKHKDDYLHEFLLKLELNKLVTSTCYKSKN